MNKIIHGDCIEKLKELEPNSVDSIVTDPPYGLSFMGKKWDYDVPSKEVWVECRRVLKPGGYLLSFAGTRTQHRMAVNIEDAGFEIRDMITWVYGSGFPKSLNIGKAVDKINGIESESLPTIPMQEATEVGAISKNRRCAICLKAISSGNPCQCDRTYKAQNEYEGWGTALKPALEPITVARKPLGEKTVAENVLKWGTGGINIDGSRVETEDNLNGGGYNTKGTSQKDLSDATSYATKVMDKEFVQPQGRFPANLIHDGSDEVVSLFPETKGPWGNKKSVANTSLFSAPMTRNLDNSKWQNDGESAARFFYCAKASKADRDEGLEGFDDKEVGNFDDDNYKWDPEKGHKPAMPRKNFHPTVKPTKLMQYLVKLVTPKGGTCLDPFMGSGSTGKACKLEGFDFIGIEREEEYINIAEARINAVQEVLL